MTQDQETPEDRSSSGNAPASIPFATLTDGEMEAQIKTAMADIAARFVNSKISKDAPTDTVIDSGKGESSDASTSSLFSNLVLGLTSMVIPRSSSGIKGPKFNEASLRELFGTSLGLSKIPRPASTPGTSPKVTLHLIRHAQAWHNLMQDGSIPNPELTDHGEKQCAHVLKNFPYMDKITHVFASPTHRTLQTAYECFKPLFNERALKMHIWDPLVELGDQPSNMSDPLPALKIRMDEMGYPVDLSGLKQGYEMNTKSSLYGAQRLELVKTRLYDFCMDPEVSGGEELEILIVSHGSFLRHLLGGGQKHRFHNTHVRSCQFASEAQFKDGAKPYDIFETEESKDRPKLVLFENAPPGFQDFWDERRLVIHQWQQMISKEYESMIPCPTIPGLLEMFPPPQVIWECLDFSPHFTLDQLRCEYKYHLLDCSTYLGRNKVAAKMESTTETIAISQAGNTQSIIEDPLQSPIKQLQAEEGTKSRVEEWAEKIEEEKRKCGRERLDDNKIVELAKSLRLPVIQSRADATGELSNSEGSSTEDGGADAAVESCPGDTDATKDEKQDVQECLALPREDPSLSPIRDIENHLADEEKPPKRQCQARTL